MAAPIAIAGLALIGVGFFIHTATKELTETLAQKGIPLDLGMSVSMIGLFMFVFKVVQGYFITPLGNAIDERNSNLEHTFVEAESLRSEMQKMRSDYEAKLAQTEADARSQIQAEVKKAQELRTSIMAEASKNADSLVQRAQDEIASEKAKALTEIRTHVVDLTMQAATKVVGENMDNDRNRRLVQEFIDTVEVRA